MKNFARKNYTGIIAVYCFANKNSKSGPSVIERPILENREDCPRHGTKYLEEVALESRTIIACKKDMDGIPCFFHVAKKNKAKNCKVCGSAKLYNKSTLCLKHHMKRQQKYRAAKMQKV